MITPQGKVSSALFERWSRFFHSSSSSPPLPPPPPSLSSSSSSSTPPPLLLAPPPPSLPLRPIQRLKSLNFLSAMDQNQLRYSFNYNKRGFEPIEFKDCLTSKVDKLLEPINLQQINTIKRQEIDKVKEQVCIREDKYEKSKSGFST